jgi:hypothetical protein
MAKSKITRPYPPEYVDVASLAYQLSVSPSTIENLERDGRLPPRRNFFGIRRWKWAEIEKLIDGSEAVERSKFVERISV